VAHALKGGGGEEEEDADRAAALPHAVTPVGAPSVFCCGGQRSVYCCDSAEEPKGCGDGEEETDGEAVAAFAHAVAPVGAPSAAAAGLYGEWRGYRKSCCFAEKRWFRKGQVTRRGSVARRATFDNWRLAAEQGSQMAWSVTTGVVS
jgi:hypothetical protein